MIKNKSITPSPWEGRGGIHDFDKPSLTVDCVVFGYDLKALKVLLVNRKEAPFKNHWALPGGFLKTKTETFEDTATRVLATKTGLTNLYMEQLYTFGAVERDERGRVVSVVYFALVNPHNYQITNGLMNNETQWFAFDELPNLAFDHSKIVAMAQKRLQNKVRYQPIGFDLLDKEFTISELQRLYETIVGFAIDRRNFRKKMLALEIIQATGEKRAIGGHRSPDVYVFNKEKYDELVENGFEGSILSLSRRGVE